MLSPVFLGSVSLECILLNLSRWTADYGVTRSFQGKKLTVVCKTSSLENMQVFYQRLSECKPGRHTWAPWSLAICRLMWFSLLLVSIRCLFGKRHQTPLVWSLEKEKHFQILQHMAALCFYPCTWHDSYHKRQKGQKWSSESHVMSYVQYEACDLLSSIVWYSCTRVFIVKRKCNVI